MRLRRAALSSVVLALAAGGCSSKTPERREHDETGAPAGSSASEAGDDAAAKRAGPAAGEVDCELQRFAPSVDLAEASGAVYVESAAPFLLVVGDSGTGGAFVELDPDTGRVLREGRLPLERGVSDDLEGLARIGDTFYGLTSGGWVRHWRRTGEGYRRSVDAYPIAVRDADELVCKSPKRTNCAKNYEGLCLDPTATPGPKCAGFAASKSEGRLYCVRLADDGRLSVDRERVLPLTRPEALTGCHIDPDGSAMWAGTNLFARSAVFRVEDWRDPASAVVARAGSLGIGFPEAIASGPEGSVFRFSDTAGAPSLLAKYRCRQ